MATTPRPFLTVIIPAYNAEKYLEETVLSLLNQPCKDLQVVIVNDGSKDGTLSLANRLKKQHMRVHVIDQKNSGSAAARNAGLDLCVSLQTEYIAFLDSDDVWTDSFYDADLRDQMRQSQKDIYYFGFYYANTDLTRGRKVTVVPCDDHNGMLAKYGIHCCYFYKYRIIQKHQLRFPQGFRTQEDTTFTFTFCSAARTFAHIPKEIFLYRSNPNSVSHAKFDPADRYFNHAIPAWKWAEQEVLRIAKAEGTDGSLGAKECATMQKGYLSEFICIACQEGLPLSSIFSALRNSGMISLYDNIDTVWVSEVCQSNWDKFIAHPREYWIRFRFRGIAIKFGQRIRNLSIIQKRRYPIALDGVYRKKEFVTADRNT